MKTPNAELIVDGVVSEFGDRVRVGAWDCRRIAGLLEWSQHAYTENPETGVIYAGNASDIFPETMAVGDRVAAFIREEYAGLVRVVLWRVKNHFDHVHNDPWPRGIGLPPCKGGELRVKHKDGTVGRTFNVKPPPPHIPPPPIGDYEMTAAEFASRLSQEQVKAICNQKGIGGVWVISPTSSDRTTITNYYLSILGTPTNPDWVAFFQEVQTEALTNAAITL